MDIRYADQCVDANIFGSIYEMILKWIELYVHFENELWIKLKSL